MIMVYILGVFFFIIFCGFSLAVLDLGEELHEDWQKNVKAEDLRKLGKSIKN